MPAARQVLSLHHGPFRHFEPKVQPGWTWTRFWSTLQKSVVARYKPLETMGVALVALCLKGPLDCRSNLKEIVVLALLTNLNL